MKSIRLIQSLLILGLLIVFSCQKESLMPPEGYESVILDDLTGLDGCGFVFRQKNNECLEPTNLNDFSIKLIDGDEYWIKYENDSIHGSYCMVGDVIILSDLKTPFKN